jgi:hypothetical protein
MMLIKSSSPPSINYWFHIFLIIRFRFRFRVITIIKKKYDLIATRVRPSVRPSVRGQDISRSEIARTLKLCRKLTYYKTTRWEKIQASCSEKIFSDILPIHRGDSFYSFFQKFLSTSYLIAFLILSNQITP